MACLPIQHATRSFLPTSTRTYFLRSRYLPTTSTGRYRNIPLRNYNSDRFTGSRCRQKSSSDEQSSCAEDDTWCCKGCKERRRVHRAQTASRCGCGSQDSGKAVWTRREYQRIYDGNAAVAYQQGRWLLARCSRRQTGNICLVSMLNVRSEMVHSDKVRSSAFSWDDALNFRERSIKILRGMER